MKTSTLYFIRNVMGCALVAFFFLIGGKAKAQTDEADTTLNLLLDMSLEELMGVDVVYSGSNVSFDKNRQPVSITTITQSQLQLSGSRTLIECINTFVPGFFMVEDQDDVIAGFRGLAPDNNSKIMLLINGQNMNTEWFGGPPSSILTTTNFEWIEHIEVIRGPGSVTLGQGALLGVINIITKSAAHFKENKQDGIQANGFASVGLNQLFNLGGYVGISKNEFRSFIHVEHTHYEGQEMRDEGWAQRSNEGFRGGSIYEMGHRINRAENTNLSAKLGYKSLDVDFSYFRQKKDLYNFYRDRDGFEEQVVDVSLKHDWALAEKVKWTNTASFTIADISLYSVETDWVMGGTRENRYGFRSVMNFNEVIKNNNTAIGFEYRNFDFGKNNFAGNNFIANQIPIRQFEMGQEEVFIAESNADLTMGYAQSIGVASLFLESFHDINAFLTAFGAVRYDRHPFWGSNLSPRFGALITPNERLRFRVSYQTGFRGAVGLSYGGGFRRDGFLSYLNYDKVADAQIPIFDGDGSATGEFEGNISEILPERLRSFEVAADVDVTKRFSLGLTGFYNQVENIIDVGVIYRDPAQFEMVNVGSDIAGDWNGYWFFKNSAGTIQQAGAELILNYSTPKYNLQASHSLVHNLDGSAIQASNMYINEDGNFKAYPANVTRVNALYSLSRKVTLSLNYLYYYNWYSPRNQSVEGSHILNVGSTYKPHRKVEFLLNVKNILNQAALYPMNNNAGDNSLSDGTPSLENTTFWLSCRYSL